MSGNADKDPVVTKGLKGVLAADSSICLVNGTEGKLLYRGYNIDDLATNGSFEETAYLLFKGELPTPSQADEFKAALAASSWLPEPVGDFLRSLPKDVLPMTALRSAMPETESASVTVPNPASAKRWVATAGSRPRTGASVAIGASCAAATRAKAGLPAPPELLPRAK